MSRQNVYSADGHTIAGWFDLDAAEEWDEGLEWDGQNRVSMATRVYSEHQRLYRTAGEKWVLHSWSQWQGRGDRWQYISSDDARDWMLRNELDSKVIEAAFSEAIPDEVVLGRPAVGPQVKVRMDERTVGAVDALAQAAGMTRSAWIRQAVEAAVREQ